MRGDGVRLPSAAVRVVSCEGAVRAPSVLLRRSVSRVVRRSSFGTELPHRAFHLTVVLSPLAAFLLSVCYHTLMSHTSCCESRETYRRLLGLDVTGVVIALSVPWSGPLWYSFHDDW